MQSILNRFILASKKQITRNSTKIKRCETSTHKKSKEGWEKLKKTWIKCKIYMLFTNWKIQQCYMFILL
jgi:hypothetical protein